MAVAPKILGLGDTTPEKELGEYTEDELRELLKRTSRKLYQVRPEILKAVVKVLETFQLDSL